jgi:hypothetical protein
MKNLLKFGFVAVLVLVMAVSVWAQRPAGGSGSGSSGSGASGSSDASRGVGTGTSTGSYTASPSVGRDFSSSSGGSYSSGGPSRTYGGGTPTTSNAYTPSLVGTSFYSDTMYWQFMRFQYYLSSFYGLNSYYFNRFTTNREPLTTPELVKLTFRKPLKLSLQMLDSVQELEQMLNNTQSGQQVDKQAVLAKIQEIRDLGRQIQKDQGLDYFDQRRDKDAFKDLQADKLGLDAIAKLREIVTDLSTQMKNMYNQTTPSVVSVQTLTEPSFKSTCKEIDKLTKVLESSARRL